MLRPPVPPPAVVGPPPGRASPAAVVLTRDPLLARHLLSVLAAVGLEVDQPAGPDDLVRAWRGAAAVLVGHDRVAEVHERALPARPDVYVVARDEDREEAYAWSARLRAAVVALPEGAGDLAAALSGLTDGPARGRIVAVVGGAGGVGASTLAAALALTGARQGRRTLLLDTDLAGGGLDVLVGAEHLAGWRWSRFASARGHLTDLAGQLPHVDGVDVLAVDLALSRTTRSTGTGASTASAGLAAEPLDAVVGSARRSHELVVVDVPRAPGPEHEAVLRAAGLVVLVVRADVRGVAAARHAAQLLVPRCRVLEVVVRTGRGLGLEPAVVADALDLPLAGVLEEDRALPVDAERGDPPGRSTRSPLVRLCERLLPASGAVAA